MRRFKPYPKYKDSGVDWLGAVPAHWVSKRLKFVAPIRVSRLDLVPDGVPYIGLEHVESWTGQLLLGSQPEAVDSVVGTFRAGDVLFGKLRPYLAKAASPVFDGVCTSEILTLRPIPPALQRYVMYSLLNAQHIRYLDSLTFGTKMPRLSPDQVGSSFTPLPPEPEQRAITAFLDRETARIDGLVQKKEKLIELLQEQRTAIITRAVTKGLDDTVSTTDSGVEWLAEIPEHWEVKPIRTLARSGYKTFTDGDWIESPFIRDEGIRLIQTGNVGIGEYKEQGYRYIDEATFRSFRCTEVVPGDVLICRLADPVGRACLAPDLGCRMITSVDVCILKPAGDMDAAFVVYALSGSEYLAWLSGICRGGTRDRVSRSMLGAIRVQKPPLVEQRAIVAFLDRETARINALVTKVREAIDRLQELRTALISAAVTGKIDVRQEVF